MKNLQDSFPLYADNFPVWSEQATGLTQANVWTALAQENIGANLQHYNPVIDEAVAAEWSIPANWNLRAQMVMVPLKRQLAKKNTWKIVLVLKNSTKSLL